MADRADDLERPHLEAAELVAGTARGLVPVLRGVLLGGIYAVSDDGSGAALSYGAHARPIHFGWPDRNIEPQPYLYDAADRRYDQVIERYERHVLRLVARFEQETPG